MYYLKVKVRNRYRWLKVNKTHDGIKYDFSMKQDDATILNQSQLNMCLNYIFTDCKTQIISVDEINR